MHNEEDLGWGSYAAACIRQILARIGASEPERESIDGEKIFTQREGGDLISLKAYIEGLSGWRLKPDGSREQVSFYEGWGWMSDDELYVARRNYRDAP